jgi:hypothetical protein
MPALSIAASARYPAKKKSKTRNNSAIAIIFKKFCFIFASFRKNQPERSDRSYWLLLNTIFFSLSFPVRHIEHEAA